MSAADMKDLIQFGETVLYFFGSGIAYCVFMQKLRTMDTESSDLPEQLLAGVGALAWPFALPMFLGVIVANKVRSSVTGKSQNSLPVAKAIKRYQA